MPKAIIIGGGIGGLATAVALKKIGVEALVFERTSIIQEIGAGLSLWSNAVDVLRQLKLEGEIIPKSSLIEKSQTFTDKNLLLNETEFSRLSLAMGSPSICIHRADLQKALINALPYNSLFSASTCTHFEQDEKGVTAHFADGRSESGDFIIGADGIHSVVRSQLRGKIEPRYAGYTCWRGISQAPLKEMPEGTAYFFLGKGCQVGLFRCGLEQVYWFATFNAPQGSKIPPVESRKEIVLEQFKNWPAIFLSAIEGTENEAILKNDIVDFPPCWPWGSERVTLLGDAAHATTPNLGQGACQALEDSLELACCLRESTNISKALRQYENNRRKRTAMVTKESWKIGKILQWDSSFKIWLRSFISKSSLGKRQTLKLFNTLLTYKGPSL